MNQVKSDREWLLERYLLGELPPGQRRELEQELKDNPSLRAELERLRLSDAEILGAYPAERLLPEIRKRAAFLETETTVPRRRRLAWVPALAAAALLLLLLPPVLRQRPGKDAYTGTKGGTAAAAVPRLQVFRRGTGSEEALRSGDQARAGDLLQLAYLPGKETHGVILSIDGGGGVTLHFPDREGSDTALQGGGSTLLPRSFELDRAPLFERFFFITASEPLPTAMLLERARQLAGDPGRALAGRLDLPGRFRQFSFLVRK